MNVHTHEHKLCICRTLGVLTKPDLVGPGNEDEVLSVLKNIRKPLKLGYVVVKCRSQADINAGIDNKAALADERKVSCQHNMHNMLHDEQLVLG
jgi:interferon-induced GTP-binding protein Mx